MGLNDYGEEEKDEKEEAADASGSFHEFDCPVCNANNPYDEGIASGDEIRCFYCGAEFRASIGENGKLKLKEL